LWRAGEQFRPHYLHAFAVSAAACLGPAVPEPPAPTLVATRCGPGFPLGAIRVDDGWAAVDHELPALRTRSLAHLVVCRGVVALHSHWRCTTHRDPPPSPPREIHRQLHRIDERCA